MTDRPAALLTDATHFVGPETADALVKAGFAVMASDKDFADAAIKSAFEAAHPGVTATATEATAPLIEETLAAFGRIDALINHNAYPPMGGPAEKISADVLRPMLDDLIVRPLELTAAVIPHMRDAGGGKIIFVTSAAPIGGSPNAVMYVAARGGANAAVKSLAIELGRHNIQVNAVAPNFIANPTYYPPELLADETAKAKILSRVPMKRLGNPSEPAALITFLAGNEADFVTGQVISAAGGWG